MESDSASSTQKLASVRLKSLDLLRGLDILLLTVIGPLLWACDRVWGLPVWVTEQLRHVPWEGLHVWDLIMPLFIFMCGAAIPFALPKRLKNGRAGWTFWRHVFGRVLLLWVLGMMVQGNLLSLDPAKMSPYNNTLQTIAAGYLIAALTLLIPKRNVRIAMPFVLTAVYGLILACFGDYSQTGNAAIRVERWVLPMNGGNYSWVLTTLMFGVMTLCGVHCTELLRCRLRPWMKAGLLATFGAVLLGGGCLLGFWEPAIKHIFTVSFTAQAMGWGVLALAVLYVFADVLGLCRGFGFVTLFGQYALMAYMLENTFAPVVSNAAAILVQGVPHWLGPKPQPVIQSIMCALLITGVLFVRKRLKSH